MWNKIFSNFKTNYLVLSKFSSIIHDYAKIFSRDKSCNFANRYYKNIFRKVIKMALKIAKPQNSFQINRKVRKSWNIKQVKSYKFNKV